MNLRPSGTPHILLDERGRGWIDDTNVKVVEVVLDKLGYGWNPDEIHSEYPHLSLGQIHAAFLWYYDHKDEYDAEIERQGREYQRLRAESIPDDPLRRKLREMGKLP